MSDYVKATNFATKDALAPGSALKRVQGTELDVEFNAIATAVGTKSDKASPNLTGTPTAPTAVYGTNTSQIATTAFVQAALQALYPVGTIYTSVVSTNPNTLFGFGTWVAFGTGRTLVGLNSGDTSFDTVEETGGSKDAIVVSHSHTASVSDPGHNHAINDISGSGSGAAGIDGISRTFEGTRSDVIISSLTGITVGISTAGSSGTNANLPPYIVVYFWKRTA